MTDRKIDLDASARGMHHVGLATHDMEATLSFYEETLGFPARVCEMIQPQTGGAIRHAFLDVGHGELIAFMECNEMPEVPDFDPGINRGLGIRGGMIHFAFKVDDAVALEKRRTQLLERGVKVRGIVDHGWCKSIYFHDPNGIQLEYCCLTEELGEEHVRGRESEDWKRWTRTGGGSGEGR